MGFRITKCIHAHTCAQKHTQIDADTHGHTYMDTHAQKPIYNTDRHS